ncbi:MAG: hypothetical protein ABIK44_04595 [candidate division WOR-3 bacterium]
MRDAGQLIVVVGLALLILIVGANEAARCSTEPRIIAEARAQTLWQNRKEENRHRQGGLPDVSDEEPDLDRSGAANPIQPLFELVFGDLEQGCDTTQSAQSALREQYGEWGRLYKTDSLLANPHLRRLLKNLLAPEGSK